MNLKGVGNIVGAFIGLAIIAIVAAKPAFIATTFTGANSLLGTAISPVTGTAKRK